MKIIRAALEKLGYLEIETAKYYQFVKPISASRHVKLDLLAGPLGKYESRVKRDSRRVRPQPGVKLHARRVDEALRIENGCMEIGLTGRLSSGDTHDATVFVPQAFSYLLMKLFAFRDRKDDHDKEMGRHHALDVLRIVAMMTRHEYDGTKDQFHECADREQVQQVRRIVEECFADEDAIGMIRIREHPLFRQQIDIPAFLDSLHSLLSG